MAKQSEATLLLKFKEVGSNILSKTKNALGDIRTWAAAALTAMTSGFAIKAWKEQEEAINALNQSLVNQGIYSKELSNDYQKLAAELQKKTKFSDDDIIKAQAQLQTYAGQTKISKDLIKATLDLATAKKIDLHSAAEMVGKSIGTEMNALKRGGIEVELFGDKQNKMVQITQALNSKFEGQAEAAVQGLGSIDLMNNAFGELAEVIGEKLAPLVVWFTKNLINLANELQNNSTLSKILGASVSILTVAFIFLKTIILNAKDIIMGFFSAVGGALVAISKGEFSMALNIFTTQMKDASDKVIANNENAVNEISEVLSDFYSEGAERDAEEARLKAESEKRKHEIIKAGIVDLDKFLEARSEDQINKELVNYKLREDAHIKHLNAIIAQEGRSTVGLKAELEKRRYIDEQYKKDEIEREGDLLGIKAAMEDKRVKKFEEGSKILAGMQSSKNKTLAGIGKAAAIANIGIDTARGAVGVYTAMAQPWAGPVGVAAGIAGAAAITAFGAEKAATVAGINLAEGGIVKSTPGGVQATIGEGGRDEAVIPLESGSPIGHRINIVIQGGLLGDSSQAREFALALDRELFKLRQANQSISFDKGVI